MRLRKLAKNIEMQAIALASEIKDMLDFGDSDIRKEFYDPSKLSYGFRVAESMIMLSNAVDRFDKELNIETEGEKLMNVPPKPMHLKDHKTPKAWRMNADTIHSPDGKWIKLCSCYKPLKLDCACRDCVQGDYLDDKGNSVLIEGVAVGCHEESDVFLENCVGLYAKDEMVEVEVCEFGCIVDCNDCGDLVDTCDFIPF